MAKFIICGAGRVGSKIAHTLQKANAELLIVERDPKHSAWLTSQGHKVLTANICDSATFDKIDFSRTKWLVAALGNDPENLLIVLKAKDKNPKIKTAARASTEEGIEDFHKAGVDLIVMPELIGGLHLANAILGKANPRDLQTVKRGKKGRR